MSIDFDIRVRRGNLDIDVCGSIADCQVLAILGPNGAGKSTVLQALSGLTPIDSGAISCGGDRWDDPSQDVLLTPNERPVGMVFQDYLLFDHMTCLDNVAFGLRARGMKRARVHTQATQILGTVDLASYAHKFPRQLSGGEAQRVALARALVVAPELLLLDEPLAALDVTTRRTVRRDLRKYLAQYSGSVILVTHDPIDAYALADRLMIIEDGKVTHSGTVREVITQPRTQYVADLMGTNLIVGSAQGSVLTTGSTRVIMAERIEGDVFAIIRPQAITLIKNQQSLSSARNSWPCTVTDIENFGERSRISLSGELDLIAEITVSAVSSLQLEVGDRVVAVVKATDIEVFAK